MAININLMRPDDLLNLQIEGENLQLDKADPNAPILGAIEPARSAYLIVTFPPQTTAEEAFYQASFLSPPASNSQETTRNNAPKPPENPIVTPVRARLGQPSRLVFEIPANTNPRIPYTIAGLLDWTGLKLSVSALANVPENPTDEQRNTAPSIAQPGKLETAIELPYRLILSPSQNVVWTHELNPKTHAGRTELWHTRLALQDGELSRTHPAPLRAIWSPDYVAEDSESGKWTPLGTLDQWSGADVLTAMNRRDRHEIVILTSAFNGFVKDLNDNPTYQPKPIYAEQLMLSPLGGWLKSRGNWEPTVEWIFRLSIPIDPVPRPRIEQLMELLNPELRVDPARRIPFPVPPFRLGVRGEPLNLSEWVHVATQGRDHYVRIVYEGYLYPFGHRAAWVKVTERKFKDVNGTPIAYLAQRMFIVVRKPLKDYAIAPMEHQGRTMPLKTVQLTTLVTPDIDPPAALHGTQSSFWVRVSNQDFEFHAVSEDSAGHRIDFTTPLIFVPNSDTSKIAAVRTQHNLSGDRRACMVPGQSITFADRDLNNPADNTTLTTRSLHFDTQDAPLSEFGGFLPKLFKAEVNLAAVEQLLGTSKPTTIAYYADYLNNGFGDVNGLFARIVKSDGVTQDAIQAVFSGASDKAGGVATPDLSIKGLTRKLGPLAGDLAKAAADQFDAADFFNDVKDSAKLFGSLSLLDLIPAGGSSSQNAPKIQFKAQPVPTVELFWEPEIKKEDVGFGILNFKRTDTTKLTVEAHIEKPIGAGQGKATFSGKLNDFTLDFLNVVVLQFVLFAFKSETGKKTDVTVQLNPTEPLKFQGELEFVEEFKQIIPPGLFGDGPSLDIDAKHIRAGFGIGLPPIAIGVFALKDVNLDAALELPFADGNPLFDFGISKREHPFNLTIAIFGGGGFFHLQLDTKGIRQLEAALEFGASASINLGVASGGVHIMAGIYFKLERKTIEGKDTDAATLSGYLRLGGELSILGLISISLEFNLSFTYEKPGKASGRATLTVKVEILFFSKSVEVTVEKRFGSKRADPTFAQLWDTPSIWDEYAGAFA